jgi:hypothetical protein
MHVCTQSMRVLKSRYACMYVCISLSLHAEMHTVYARTEMNVRMYCIYIYIYIYSFACFSKYTNYCIICIYIYIYIYICTHTQTNKMYAVTLAPPSNRPIYNHTNYYCYYHKYIYTHKYAGPYTYLSFISIISVSIIYIHTHMYAVTLAPSSDRPKSIPILSWTFAWVKKNREAIRCENYTYTHKYMHTYTHTYIHICTCTCICICLCVCTHICQLHTCVCACLCVRACMHICTYIHTRTQMDTCMCIASILGQFLEQEKWSNQSDLKSTKHIWTMCVCEHKRTYYLYTYAQQHTWDWPCRERSTIGLHPLASCGGEEWASSDSCTCVCVSVCKGV